MQPVRALILFDPHYATQDDVTRTTASLMTAHARVRLVRVDQAAAPDFDGINCVVMACEETAFSPDMQTAYDCYRQQGMQCIPLVDVDKMLWFRSEAMRRAM